MPLGDHCQEPFDDFPGRDSSRKTCHSKTHAIDISTWQPSFSGQKNPRVLQTQRKSIWTILSKSIQGSRGQGAFPFLAWRKRTARECLISLCTAIHSLGKW